MREFGVSIQFCLAHLIRNVMFLTTLPDKKQQAYGKRVREALPHTVRPSPRYNGGQNDGRSRRALK